MNIVVVFIETGDSASEINESLLRQFTNGAVDGRRSSMAYFDV
jgi:hypothetical protein